MFNISVHIHAGTRTDAEVPCDSYISRTYSSNCTLADQISATKHKYVIEWYLSVCICMCVYLCVHVYVYAYACMSICMYLCTHVRMYVCMHIYG